MMASDDPSELIDAVTQKLCEVRVRELAERRRHQLETSPLAVAIQLVNEGVLHIDDAGRIWRQYVRTPNGLKKIVPRRAERVSKNGRLTVKVRLPGTDRSSTVQPHRLIWTWFCGPIPDGMQINHKDLNPLNNAIDNLELVNRSENVLHSWQHIRPVWNTLYDGWRREHILYLTPLSFRQMARCREVVEQSVQVITQRQLQDADSLTVQIEAHGLVCRVPIAHDCRFVVWEIETGLRMRHLAVRIDAVQGWPNPTNFEHLMSYFGFQYRLRAGHVRVVLHDATRTVHSLEPLTFVLE